MKANQKQLEYCYTVEVFKHVRDLNFIWHKGKKRLLISQMGESRASLLNLKNRQLKNYKSPSEYSFIEIQSIRGDTFYVYKSENND